ncbi:mycofactocin system transcriptional regulator [Microbacterium sp. X-17]|uniref:mycofactocin system transcriptional regulator n=1 Tax=Microbacterium sp. X-17 TaxID=3144404 RepID=UPI0031F51593
MSEAERIETARRSGRARATTHGELSHIGVTLFLERGFDETTIDEIVAAAGIGRRTFFRYFASKNDLPWGDFDRLLSSMRAYLDTVPADVPLREALRRAVIDFNRYPADELPYHRQRMQLLLNVPTLVAHSTLRYAAWRDVLAEFVGARLHEPADSIEPQAIAWVCLGLSLAAYEQWLARPEADLLALIDEAFVKVGERLRDGAG